MLRTGMRPLTPLEAVFIVAVGSSVLCAAVPAFVRNVRASRLAEPVDGLQKIASRASALAAGRPTQFAYPPSTGMTPSRVPAGTTQLDPEGTWDHPTWRILGFRFTNPHAFAFTFESQCSAEESRFTAMANGDLDGDGLLSTFEIRGEVKSGDQPQVGRLDVWREVE
jgi:hypothetical protein